MKSSKVENDKRKSSRVPKSIPTEESPPKLRSRASPSRSPARVRKTSPGAPRPAARRSPARKPSPGRRSPSRRSPARKSPSRNAKELDEAPKSPSRRPAIKLESSKVTSSIPKLEIQRLSRPVNVEIKKISNDILDNLNGIESINIKSGLRERKPKVEEFTASRRSTRVVRQVADTSDNFEKLLNLAQSTKLPKEDSLYDNFSDGDNLSEDDTVFKRSDNFKKDKSLTRKLATPLRELSLPRSIQLEFGGWIGAAFQLLFTPLIIIGLNVYCSPSQCSFSWPNLKPYNHLDMWFSSRAVLVYVAFLSIQAVVSLIPFFGRRVPLPNNNGTLTTNGVFSLLLTLSIMAALEYVNIPIFKIIHSEYIALIVTAIGFGLLLSIGLFIMSRKVPAEYRNKYGNTGNVLYDFWMGREVNPRLFGIVQIKLLFLRTALIAAILMNCVSLFRGTSVAAFPAITNKTIMEFDTYSQIANSFTLRPTLVTFASMQIVYFLHAIINEPSLISTFEFQYEGTGCMLALGYSLYPFTTMLITKYVLEHNVILPNIALAASVAVYLTGFYIYHASNYQKNAFRKNPLDPKLAHLESLPTFYGKRLLISGWWGFVRHPNYLGDIILHLSWAAATLTAPPVLFVVLTVFFLAHRASRDGVRCRKRYGTAWDRYCRRVPYNIIPKVY